jgi:hypothetical protein
MTLSDVCSFYRNHHQISEYCIPNITLKKVFLKKKLLSDFGLSLLFKLLTEKD